MTEEQEDRRKEMAEKMERDFKEKFGSSKIRCCRMPKFVFCLWLHRQVVECRRVGLELVALGFGHRDQALVGQVALFTPRLVSCELC